LGPKLGAGQVAEFGKGERFLGRYARIVSTALYKPARLIGNDQMREWLREFPEFIDKLEQGTGIRQRWWAPED